MEFMNTSDLSTGWRWRWEDLCGADGLKIWSAKTHDLGLCFEQFCIKIPVLCILATASAFYFGQHVDCVIRGKVQLMAINIRCLIVACFFIMPVLQVYIDLNTSNTHFEKIDYFLAAVEATAWFTHLGYTSVLRKRLGLSPRGPVIMVVIWTLIAVLSFITLRTHYLIYQLAPQDPSVLVALIFAIVKFFLQILYTATLIPGQGDTAYINPLEGTENQPLIHNPYSRFSEEQDPNYLGVAMENATFMSKLLFYWVEPLMKKGVEGHLNHSDDLYDLPDSLGCTVLALKLDKALIGNVDNVPKEETERMRDFVASSSYDPIPEVKFQGRKKHHVSLLTALHKCFWLQFYGVGILRLIADCAGFAGPMLLNKLVSFIEDKSIDVNRGYLYASLLCLTTLIAAFSDAHFNFYMAIVGLKIRGALITTIYRKVLTISGAALHSTFSSGEIINFMSTDTDRIVNSCPSFHAVWSIPFQIAVSLYLLYTQVGFAFLAGLFFSIALIPINKVIANKIGQLSTKMMECKDERVKMVTETLRGIRTIKIHVWEEHFLKVILRLREGELKYLKSRKYLDALCVYFWATTPVLISILTFGTYVLMGNELTAATVFTSMALVNMLIGPLNAFPWVLNGITEAWVSIKRIQRLLNLPDLDTEVYYNNDLFLEYPNCNLVIQNGTFNWGKLLTKEEVAQLHDNKECGGDLKGKKVVKPDEIDAPRDFSLSDINITIKKGEFVGVMGSVGSGKSSLFAALQAEIIKQKGAVAVCDLEKGFGVVTQQPWLRRGTIRDNILFGKTFDQTKYMSVVFACGLNEDLYLLPSGDMTGVGEGGMTLSGGQKARIALARAVYQDKHIYLLDDIISAVDSKVAKHIFQHCIMGLLANKTRILCTHRIKYLIHADRIIVIEKGAIKQQGAPAEILSNIDEFLPIDLELEESVSLQSDYSSSFMESVEREVPQDNDSILNEETRESGTVRFGVYAIYWKAVGHLLSLSILLSMVLMQSSRNVTDWWLSYWVSNVSPSNSTRNETSFILLSLPNYFIQIDSQVKYYLSVYIAFAALNSLFTFFRAFLFAYGGVCAASKVHKLLMKSIIRSKVAFFDISPLGRILNRFSSDTYTVDDSLPFIINILLAQFFAVIGSVILTIYGLPWLCLILVPLIPVYHWLQHYYRLTSRELKRLSSTTLSPVYSHFNETLQGLATIRAFRTTHRFKRDNEENVEANIKAQFASQVAARWLGLRLQFIGVAMVSGVGFIAVIQHQFDVANPGLIGLAISYALSITGLLSGVVNAFTETEREMIAVERISQYIEEVEPETSYFITDPPYGFPCQGVISFNNVILKYREHLTPALKGVSFETRPAEKIGVVGRTGAGKSSVVAALFRLVELNGGSITIDTVNIAHLSLQSLRSRLSCIPQEPFLFSGTIRENLDPLNEYRDPDIWSALNRVDLSPTVKNLGGLEFSIAGGGQNLSVGQRQLFCLARAVLHNTKIICIDEATANVDHDTDRLIQHTLRTAFRKSTVITIAHRIQTVLDYDRVLVMGDGQVLEFGVPDELVADPTSHFYKLVNQD